MSADAPPALDVDLVGQITLARYFAGIALTLCVYDWLILLGRESQTVWKARWTRTKVLYYFNRVITLVGLIIVAAQNSDLWTKTLSHRVGTLCIFYIWFTSMLQWASFCIANTILTLRITALYYRHVLLVRILYCLLVINWLSALATTIHTIYLMALQLDYSPELHLCASSVRSPTAPVIFIGPATYEFILFVLTLYRAVQDRRNRVTTGPFLATLYRDGFYYFAAVFAVHLWNSLAYLTLPMTGIFMGVYFAWSTMTIMSGRVFLNLVLAVHGRRDTEGVTTAGISSLRMRRARHLQGDESGQTETFGAKNIRHNVPLTTFSTVSIHATLLSRALRYHH
ncbi:hypothetical protein CPB86DRAFT_717942 [Serendipita vermifera]|nr:hypothetical protein CPB86DRAFT_717942 [Serendipita vermifera]